MISPDDNYFINSLWVWNLEDFTVKTKQAIEIQDIEFTYTITSTFLNMDLTPGYQSFGKTDNFEELNKNFVAKLNLKKMRD